MDPTPNGHMNLALLLFCGPIKQREASCLINHMWLPPPRHISWRRE